MFVYIQVVSAQYKLFAFVYVTSVNDGLTILFAEEVEIPTSIIIKFENFYYIKADKNILFLPECRKYKAVSFYSIIYK